DHVIIGKHPHHKLPEDLNFLVWRKGEIKLVLGGEYFGQYIVEVENNLYQLDKTALAYSNDRLKSEYQIQLYKAHKGHLEELQGYVPSYYKEVPRERDIIKLLEETDEATYATVQKVYSIDRGME